MLKKLTPDQLIIGKKYLVEMELNDKDKSDIPYAFEDIERDIVWLPADQPIYAFEPTPELTDNEQLKMLVEVAGSLFANYTTMYLYDRISSVPTNSDIAREALDLIQACKEAIKEVSND